MMDADLMEHVYFLRKFARDFADPHVRYDANGKRVMVLEFNRIAHHVERIARAIACDEKIEGRINSAIARAA